MVRHQGPGDAAQSPSRQVFTDAIEERFSIEIVEKDRALFNSPGVYVMNRTRKINSWSPRHNFLHINNQTKGKRMSMEGAMEDYREP